MQKIMDSNHHFKLGREYGYPDCCIFYWIGDHAGRRNSAIQRGIIIKGFRGNGEPKAWVPCPKCMSDPDWLSWKEWSSMNHLFSATDIYNYGVVEIHQVHPAKIYNEKVLCN